MPVEGGLRERECPAGLKAMALPGGWSAGSRESPVNPLTAIRPNWWIAGDQFMASPHRDFRAPGPSARLRPAVERFWAAIDDADNDGNVHPLALVGAAEATSDHHASRENRDWPAPSPTRLEGAERSASPLSARAGRRSNPENFRKPIGVHRLDRSCLPLFCMPPARLQFKCRRSAGYEPVRKSRSPCCPSFLSRYAGGGARSWWLTSAPADLEPGRSIAA